MTSPSNPIHNIPVLTEVISLESVNLPGPAATAAIPPSAAQAVAAASAPAARPVLQELDLEQLEKTLTENVLRQLQTRIDFVLEHKVRDGLADVLQTSVEDLARDIRSGLTLSLTELIRRTVSQEISKIQSTTKI